jgi:hypothetical protein
MNLLTFVFLLALVSGLASASEDYEDYEDFTHHEVISAYCQLVQDQNFYRYHKLRDKCGLVVKIYGKKVCLSSLL